MRQKKFIFAQLELTQTFRIIAQAYQEIAVMRMRKIRQSVLANREYLSKLSEVFFDVKHIHKGIFKKQKMKSSIPTFPKKSRPEGDRPRAEKKSVVVLLSANTKLYGQIVNNVFEAFLNRIKNAESDIIIIGRWGRHLYQEQGLNRPYLYFEIPDTNVNIDYLKPVLYHLVSYEKIYVYYGKFKNLSTQVAASSNVSGDQPYGEEPEVPEVLPGEMFIFEPSIDRIMEFFEGLVASSLFKHTVYESELALLASRVMAMEDALVNINRSWQKLRLEKKKLVRLEENKKQLERLSGISLWSKL